MRAEIKWRLVPNRVKNSWQLTYTVRGQKPTSKQIARRDEVSYDEAVKLAHAFLEKLEPVAISIGDLIAIYRREDMTQLRVHTQECNEGLFRNYILPRWGETSLTELKPYPVKKWLQQLTQLAPSSRKHIRSLLKVLIDFAILREDLPAGFQNRMTADFVKIKGASRRVRKAKNLTREQWYLLSSHVTEEPFHTICILRAACGLRISESLGLKWRDVLWDIGKIEINRAVVHGREVEVKSEASGEPVVFGELVAELLKAWREVTEYAGDDDWIFASPHSGGRMPWHYETAYRRIVKAGLDAGLGRVGTHSLRHTHRSLLEDTGASDELQMKMMRHSNLSTTKGYGDVYEDRKREAHDKVAKVVFGPEDIRSLFGTKGKK